jgi:phosphatidylglycerol---prolipoprotein diacylglyceryl transferase
MPLGDSPYFVLLAIGFGVAFLWANSVGDRLGLPRLARIDVCIAALVGGIVGSRALHVMVEPLPGDPLGPEALAHVRADAEGLDPAGRAAVLEALARPPVHAPWSFIARMPAGAARDEAVAAARRDPQRVPARLWYRARPLEALLFWKGGLAYLGGLAGAVVLGFIVSRRHGVPIGSMSDWAVTGTALGLIFGRLGCFAGGCCYGLECEPAWWSTPPPWYAPPVGGVHRYPTALMLAAFDLGLFLALRRLLLRPHARWSVFLAFLALYAPGRFVVEALRADPRGGALGLSTSQLIAIATGVPAAIGWLALRRRAPDQTMMSPSTTGECRPNET